MKKGLLVAVMALLVLSARAYDYPYLVFTNTSGVTTALAADGLTATVNGSMLVVTNASGTVSFVLTDLASMQFSTDGINLVDGLENVLQADAPVRVFTVAGLSLGEFDNLLQAAQRLGKGAYVIVQNGNSQKVVIGEK